MNLDSAKSIAARWGYMTVAEIEALSKIVNMLPDNPFVFNLGAGAGTSGLTIYLSRDDVSLFTVDINLENPLGCLYAERNACQEFGIPWPNPRWHQVLGTSHEIAELWAGGGKQPDLVFVDNCHEWDCIYNDIRLWKPLIKPGGIMAFHDYGGVLIGNSDQTWPDVKRAVNQEMDADKMILRADTFIAFWV
jgi:hypothetical protein